MRPAASVEAVPGSRVALPQCVIGLAVQAGDRSPLIDDGAHPVPGGLPLRRVGRDILSLDGQCLLAGGQFGALFVAEGPISSDCLGGVIADRGEPSGQRIDITQSICGGE